jgi:flavorubredoxin
MTEKIAVKDVNSMTQKEYKVYEDRLRRMASRQMLKLCKSRTRDQRAVTYNGYMLTNQDQVIVAGGHPNEYSMSLDEIEHYLNGERNGSDI